MNRDRMMLWIAMMLLAAACTTITINTGRITENTRRILQLEMEQTLKR